MTLTQVATVGVLSARGCWNKYEFSSITKHKLRNETDFLTITKEHCVDLEHALVALFQRYFFFFFFFFNSTLLRIVFEHI
jgi:hypothetical protein